ncbi:MAG TPA: glycosyltransferase family A protein [Verrucomicrobiae bacterium]|nr:glycosyltransferase family A protein [Verrucomicrobiae bacterium]
MIRFSIIIPTYNRAALLREALESVFKQKFSDFEVIVVDDGSTDGTEETLRAFAGKIRCFGQRNRGPGAARNLGAARAEGKYLAFLDSDDLLFPWSLDVYDDVIRAHNSPAFIAGKPKVFRESAELPASSPAPLSVNAFPDYLASGDQWRWWGASSFVIRRDQFVAGKGFTSEPINGEDADLALRLGTAPGFVQVTGPETFAYRQHVSNVMKNAARNVQGAHYLMVQEHKGAYPGRDQRAHERWQILTRHVKPASVEGVRHGLRDEAWWLYRQTVRWNMVLGHWKYLFGFPILALSAGTRSQSKSA